ncbi:D-threonine aldolase [Rubripirellula lacrimiformis]|uniref:D-threonine aldolase n=1 Tax=Rubripirellula lacrimiformis TaxID=1930273 RepID=A0A517N764_9BACT|nr:D-TA family PLP-dependent enzyme [Rubripirellula lacrimiformis]QDT02983.1 D-threonine aldolase [Rubripirellula lacrimiformis]
MTLIPDWISIDTLGDVESPGLLIHPATIATNIQQMIEIVGGDKHIDRLRPHIKTHKMPDVVRLQVAAGIRRFKAATLAEAEMASRAGATDVLIAYPMVGPNIDRLIRLRNDQNQTRFAVVADNVENCRVLASAAAANPNSLDVFIDVDSGMHRTGIPFGPGLDQLRQEIESSAHLCYAGLHLYDGQLHQPSLDQRRECAGQIIAMASSYNDRLPSPEIVGGGSPTFPIWAAETDFQCSPGTPLLWDDGYGGNYPDLKFKIAAALLTRVISKPGPGRLCLDLGYKSVASEMPLANRVRFPQLPEARLVSHSEEHLVIESDQSDAWSVGQPLIGLPTHICPTVALHVGAVVIDAGRPNGQIWPITARDRIRIPAQATGNRTSSN